MANRKAIDTAALKKDIAEVNDKLKSLLKQFDKKTIKEEMLTPAGLMLQAQARANIKDSKKPHHRYGTPKLVKGIRAPKGSGVIVATYYPGNLRKAIQILNFRKSPAVWVGPKVNRRGTKGAFGKGRRVDAYYAHWQEYGTVNNPNPKNLGYMRRAFSDTKNQMIRQINRQARMVLRRYINKNKIA